MWKFTHFELGPETRGPLPTVIVVGRAGVAAGVALRVQPKRASLVFLGCSRPFPQKPDVHETKQTTGVHR